MTALATSGLTFVASDSVQDAQPPFSIGMTMASALIGISLGAHEALVDTRAQGAIVGESTSRG